MTDAANPPDDRPLWPALRAGWQRTCPACARGAMMDGYLKVADQCPGCGAELHHHRADDGPAYLTILVVGKLSLPMMVTILFTWDPDPVLLFLGTSAFVIAASLWLLPRFKGAMVALQWSRRMHGFGPDGRP